MAKMPMHPKMMKKAYRGMETPAEERAEAMSKGAKRTTKKVGSRAGKPRISRGGYR